MFSPVAAVDTFQAADLGTAHQGELLGQGTDSSMSHACKIITQVDTIRSQTSQHHSGFKKFQLNQRAGKAP